VRQRSLRLVLGLGNPGKKYYFSRHNLGYQVVDKLARDYNIALREEGLLVQWGIGKLQEKEFILAKPMTFMNLSGEAAHYLKEKLKIYPEEILVVHDDMDLPFGRLKLVQGGGSGGHKGVASIIDRLGTEQIPRLKVGIGKPIDGDGVSYVLSEFSKEEMEVLPQIIEKAKMAIELILKEGLPKAMSIFNVRTRPESRGEGCLK